MSKILTAYVFLVLSVVAGRAFAQTVSIVNDNTSTVEPTDATASDMTTSGGVTNSSSTDATSGGVTNSSSTDATASDMTTSSGVTDSASTESPVTGPEPATNTSSVTTSPTPAPVTCPQTTCPPSPPPCGFDGGSFVGGIALGVGIVFVIYVVIRCVRAKRPNYNAI